MPVYYDEVGRGVHTVRAQGDPGEDPGPGGFPAEVRLAAAGLLGHVHVADPRSVHLRGREHLVDRHRRVHGDDRGLLHLPLREHREELVPADERALLVHRDHPVPVPVVRDPEVRLEDPHGPAEDLEVLLRGLGVPPGEVPVGHCVQGGDLAAHLDAFGGGVLALVDHLGVLEHVLELLNAPLEQRLLMLGIFKGGVFRDVAGFFGLADLLGDLRALLVDHRRQLGLELLLAFFGQKNRLLSQFQ